jgi:hypothetical protein
MKNAAKKESAPSANRVQSETLRPVRMVERVLTRPDGTTCKVKVPVYPPFQLKKAPRSLKPRPDW